MFKIEGAKSQGCSYCDKCKLVNNISFKKDKINILIFHFALSYTNSIILNK